MEGVRARRLHTEHVFSGKRNPTSTKGRSRRKSSSENYLLISEVRFMVRFRVRFRVRVMVRVRD